MPELELDKNKIYNMPDSLQIEQVDDKFLIISKDTGNWLLLNNKIQVDIFNELANNKKIIDVLNMFSDYFSDFYHVLVELEAKKFENLEVIYPQEKGIYIYLTNKCNQRCRHCYMFAGVENEKELSTHEIQEVLGNFAKNGGKVVTFTGGEATIRNDFKDIVKYAKEVGLVVGVLSNGLLWSQRFIDKVKNFVDEVQISIDGFDSESYMCVRGTDTFNVALDAVEHLLDTDIRVTVAITPLLDTLLLNEQKYIDFAKKLVKKYKNKQFFIKFNTELMEGRNISPSQEDNYKYREAIRRIHRECLPHSEEEGFAIDHLNNTIFNNCGYGGISITSNGDVYFCNLVGKCLKQGNVRLQTFEQILELSKKARELSDINNLIPCKDCAIKYLCGGGCRVKYFKKLVESDIDKQSKSYFIRDVICTREQKEKIYQLMINSNNLFYR